MVVCSRKPYFIWTIFFSINKNGEEVVNVEGRKPYFIWTIFFSLWQNKYSQKQTVVVNLILYGLYSFLVVTKGLESKESVS